MKLVIVEEGKGVDTEPTLYLRSRVDSDGGLTIEASTDQTFESNVERVGFLLLRHQRIKPLRVMWRE
jgi:hypothetical protein